MWNKRETKQCLQFQLNEDPVVINIPKSGWNKPQRYHVITEHGDTGDCYHDLVTARAILAKYRIKVEDYL